MCDFLNCHTNIIIKIAIIFKKVAASLLISVMTSLCSNFQWKSPTCRR